ncbi:MAG: hypothetical protein ACRBDI_04070 [Alphaproteobacteria bacterium]
MSTNSKRSFAPENLAQAINPWSWWLEGNANENQNGFINITNYKSGNPKLEQKIVSETAGYGMQLGIIEDMLEVMIDFIPKGKVKPEQEKVILQFQEMTKAIRSQKEKDLLERFSAGSIEDLVGRLDRLKKDDPVLYEKISKKLKSAL